VIDTVLNLIFRCSHRHLTRPFTPVDKEGIALDHETYVVCLDCARQFTYDLNVMRIGKRIDHTHDACVCPPDLAKPRRTRLVYTLGVAVPAAVILGVALKTRKRPAKK
jgi:hypothetical protein